MTKINEIMEIIVWVFRWLLRLSDKTIRKILHDELNMKKVCEALVPKNLTTDQKLVCQQISLNFLWRLDEEPTLMEYIWNITGIFQYNVETKWQSMHWKTPASSSGMKKVRVSGCRNQNLKSCYWVFFIFFFSSKVK